MDNDYEDYDGQNFDVDHEGSGGYESEDVHAIDEVLQNIQTPNIVLLSIGGNDLLDGEPTFLTHFKHKFISG